jgi:hypothetical protein
MRLPGLETGRKRAAFAFPNETFPQAIVPLLARPAARQAASDQRMQSLDRGIAALHGNKQVYRMR